MTTDNTQNPIESLPLTSLDVAELQRQKLKELFPEALTEGGKVDWDKLRLTLGEMIDTGKERFGVNWPGKADCFKTIQQPSVATLVPARDESVDFDTTENLFIEGDNLEVLKLLQKSYLGKVKMIYIDPPYNTGNDFVYPDDYSESLDTYLEYTGQIDSEKRKFSTNVDTDGRFHSKWMNMMYPRLFLAKNLLREDGVIFVSIDDNEVNNLRSLMNEVFGEENFVAQLVIESNPKGRVLDKFFATCHEYVFCFSKSSLEKGSFSILKESEQIESEYPLEDEFGKYRELELRNTHREFGKHNRKNLFFPIFYNEKTGVIGIKSESSDSIKILPLWDDGFEGCWTWGTDKVEEENELLVVKEVKGKYKVYRKSYANEAKRKIKSILIDKSFHTEKGQSYFNSLFETREKIFQSPKSVSLLSTLIQTSTRNNDIVLDFFAGSATTANAVMDLNKEDGGNRRFVCVQLPERTDEKSEAYKAGYATIAEISKERIRRAAAKIKAEVEANADLLTEEKASSDLGFRVFKLQKSNFHVWDANVSKEPEAIQQALELHVDHISPQAKQEAILFELLLKSGFELTTPIEAVTLADKTVCSIADGALLICLEKQLTHELIKAMAEREPMRVVCLDEGFQNNDQLKTNAVLIMKSKGVVDFRTV